MAVINPTQDQSVRGLLTRYAGRIRLEKRRRYLSFSFLALGAIWLVSALLFYSDVLDPRSLPVALLLPLLLPIIALVLERRRKPSTIETALAIDTRLDNQQRVLTAVELLEANEPRSLDTEQLSSTADLLSPLDPRVVYPVRSPLPAYALTGGLLLLAIGIILLKGAPSGFVPIQALGLPGDEQALSALVSPTAASGLPDSNKPTETPQPEAAQTAVADSQGQQGQEGTAPSPEEQAASEDAQSGLDRLQQGLNEQSVTQGAADSLQQGNYGEAADQLAEVGEENDQLSEAAKRGLADSLERAADESGATPDLQEAERSAAEALRKGNYKQINEALKELGEQLKNTAQDVIPQQEMAQGFPEQQSQESGQQGQEGQQGQGEQSDPQSGQQQSGEQGQQEGSQSQGGEQSEGSQGEQGQQGEQGGAGAQGEQGQQGGEGQQNQSPGGGQEGEGDGQPGAPGQGTRVGGPKDTADPNVQGNPFELENQPDQGKPSQDGERPALTLEGSAGASGASPVTPGGAVNAPGESNRLPVERWQIIQRYFSRER